MVVAMIQHHKLVKLETDNISVPVICFAIVGATAVLMPAPVSSISTINPCIWFNLHCVCDKIN